MKNRTPFLLSLALIALVLVMIAGCSSATQPIEEAIKTEPTNTFEQAEPTEAPAEVTEAPAAEEPSLLTEEAKPPTPAPTASRAVEDNGEGETRPPAPTSIPDTAIPPTPEERLIELEYPNALRLGESDVIRLALYPSQDGYVLQAEFPDHTTISETVQVSHPSGYELTALARLDAVNFEISPNGEQPQTISPGQPAVWRWSLTPESAGQQRVNVTLMLRWDPHPGTDGTSRQITAYSTSLDVRVISFFGLTRGQAMVGGLVSLAAGGGLAIMLLVTGRQRPRPILQALVPNPSLIIEPRPGIEISSHERQLLSALFQKYARLTLESEFLSGYSGARTFLAIPIHPDGRADAATIVKIGETASIEREYHNYEDFVKHSLPPVTARIQQPPVVIRSGGDEKGIAALQYTFIGAPGQSPRSLRLALLEKPDPALLHKLFETFGPNWWMQRRPHTFRLGSEYDRMLPTHLIIEPTYGRGKILDGRSGLAVADLQAGDMVSLKGFNHIERRMDGNLSLRGDASPGVPPLRVRWLSRENPNGATGRVVATRQTLLKDFTSGMELYGLPDPLERIPYLLNETIHGSRSTVHGDLNLENILVGPGGFVWLIDFAQTGDGHPLSDFAHLEAEIIAHVIAPNVPNCEDYIALLNNSQPESPAQPYYALRGTVAEIASHCLRNPNERREYELARLMACLGALKFANLDHHAKHLLYLTAGHIDQQLL